MSNPIISKIKKLLALANSDNVNEAAAAAAMAAKLMEKHSINKALVDAANEATKADIEIIQQQVFHSGANTKTWVSTLLFHVAETRRCHGWTSGGFYFAAGTRENLEQVRFLMGWLVGEVERLLKKAKQGKKFSRGRGRVWSNNFRRGAVSSIGERLREEMNDQRKRLSMSRDERYQLAIEENDAETLMELDAGKYALAVVNNALARLDQEKDEADAYVEIHLELSTRKVTSQFDASGYYSGQKAGKTANLNGKVLGN